MSTLIETIAEKILTDAPIPIDPDNGLFMPSIDWRKIDTSMVDYIRLHGEEGNVEDDRVIHAPATPIALLGSYTPLPPHGVVTLYAENLSKFFWGILKKLYAQKKFYARKKLRLPENVSMANLKALAKFIVAKTYHHEIFHYRCDIASLMFGTRPDRIAEEALAVAFGHHHAWRILESGATPPLEATFYDAFRNEAFTYSAAGYRDWRDYEKIEPFRNKLAEHVLHPSLFRLLDGTGGQMDAWFAGSLHLFMTDFPTTIMVEAQA